MLELIAVAMIVFSLGIVGDSLKELCYLDGIEPPVHPTMKVIEYLRLIGSGALLSASTCYLILNLSNYVRYM